jgi:peptide/nickel transport system substrate-binding protein
MAMAYLSRRGLLATLAGGLPVAAHDAHGQRAGRYGDVVTIAWPCDVPGWDPNRRFMPDAQSLYHMVFDPALDQEPRMAMQPHLVRAWELAPDAMSLTLDLRDDVVFHDGTALTAADIRFTFLERPRAEPGLDLGFAWRRLAAVETPSATRAVMRFASPFATAPLWLGFLGSFVVPETAMGRLGAARFAARPVGSGPYRVAEHEPGVRVVLERNERYWGPRPVMRRVVFEFVREPWARVAAVESGRAHLAVGMPVREVWRLAANPALIAELNAVSRIVLVQLRSDGPFAERDIRLAAHHALDKAALVQALYPNASRKLAVPAVPGTDAFVDGFEFPHDPLLAQQLLERHGFGPEQPVAVRLAVTSGQMPGDLDLARAIAAMWREVGIAARIEVIDPVRHFELNRAGRLPDATLFDFDNATGDPEICAGTLLDPDLPFSPWKEASLAVHVRRLREETEPEARLDGWQALTKLAVEHGAILPVMQGVQTLVRRRHLTYRPYGNGWVLPQTMDWAAGDGTVEE